MLKQHINSVNLICARLQHTWIKPTGYNTKIQLYNCTVKENVPLIFTNKNYGNWYTCGPTVYDSAHIGHACCYVKLDIIQRILRQHFDINIITIMNITDVDDKIIKRSNEKRISTSELAKFYEKEFWQDLNDLNVKRPDRVLRVSENMPVILDFIDNLVENKKAYKASDSSVYFDVDSYDGCYGKLQNIGDTFGEKGVKKSAADFALWKSAKEGEVFWESKYGIGRPGWHIECSALAGTLLGSSIDIHAGGIDLRFPHHENEEVQSCSYFHKKQWVNYWIHTGYLHLSDSIKMSKSLKNTISIQDMLKSCKAEEFRMACLISHYRNNMEFSEELIKTAKSYLQTYKNFVSECNLHLNNQIAADIDSNLLFENLNKTVNAVNEALMNDFDTSTCIKAINLLISSTNKMLHSAGSSLKLNNSSALIAVLNYVTKVFDNFGLNLATQNVYSDLNVSAELTDILVNFRQDVRLLGIKNKDQDLLKLCDNVRDQIRANGIDLKDRGKVSTWSKA